MSNKTPADVRRYLRPWETLYCGPVARPDVTRDNPEFEAGRGRRAKGAPARSKTLIEILNPEALEAFVG